MDKVRIAVIGLGPAGLTALKSLREEGFNAVAFERRNEIGGLWAFSDDVNCTSVLKETVCNISKFVSGFSDFPVPKDYPTFFTGSQVAAYFQSYASHFDLYPYIRFSNTVERITRNAVDDSWDVHNTTSGESTVLSFDKVVLAHGCESVPLWPPMPNRNKFKGTVIHSQSFKSPEAFKGKRVLVVGIGNTACEVSLSLAKHASKVYQSYRRGRILVSRYGDDGIPLDTQFSWSALRLKYLMDHLVPTLMGPLGDKFMINKMISDASRSEPVDTSISEKEKWKYTEKRVREDWRLVPAPSMAHVHPAVQEDFIPALRRGDITPAHGFKDFRGEHEVVLDDGAVVEVDAVIFCTGYELDFKIMPELEMDGAMGMPLRTTEKLSTLSAGEESISEKHQPHLPRLFQMIFPPRHASSVAILSWIAPQENVWCVSELASMAVSQIWAAETHKDSRTALKQHQDTSYRSPALLPSLEEMNAQVDAYHTWWRTQWQTEPSMRPGYVQGYSFYRFLHDAAGTGLYDNLNHIFTTQNWSLWWNDHELWTWLSKGPMNNYSWRLFDTNPKGIPGCGRRSWPGARQATKDAYEIFEDFKKLMRNKSKNA
ncbi:FAD/NAD(P)-binding domain-containing protein [Xylaria bambusicola]|uniref:FAD/NAD(P)-binding domain-containing protein n=1 Tax=Xylaria bambusicola TaxID=326684 RepID=UPI0020076241|nr:FAD/NAD(P)-binding domain-containing protein [Xylaria bambusicola]KAI0513073.1 FAD/NAD(P)-binding domain-containing protein [Xylaria bambusicola]